MAGGSASTAPGTRPTSLATTSRTARRRGWSSRSRRDQDGVVPLQRVNRVVAVWPKTDRPPRSDTRSSSYGLMRRASSMAAGRGRRPRCPRACDRGHDSALRIVDGGAATELASPHRPTSPPSPDRCRCRSPGRRSRGRAGAPTRRCTPRGRRRPARRRRRRPGRARESTRRSRRPSPAPAVDDRSDAPRLARREDLPLGLPEVLLGVAPPPCRRERS